MTSTSVSTGYNSYDLSSLYGTSMAHDFFGSQAFGSGSSVYSTEASSSSAAQTQAQPVSAQSAATGAEAAQVTEQAVQNIFETPDNYASALLQQYARMKELQNAVKDVQITDITSQTKNSVPQTSDTLQATDTAQQVSTTETQTTNSAPTFQDYYLATMIANQFANNTPLIYSDTTFTKNDYFAGKAFSSNNKNSGIHTRHKTKTSLEKDSFLLP